MPIHALPLLPKAAFPPVRRLSQLWMRLSNVFSHFPGNTNGLITLGAESHEGFGLGVEAGEGAVEDSLPDDTEGSFGTEEVFVVELFDHFQNVPYRQTGVLDVRHLTPGFV